jgi:hypothetical protein
MPDMRMFFIYSITTTIILVTSALAHDYVPA